MEFEHVKPMDIEKRSMEIIGQELAEMGIPCRQIRHIL